MLADTFPFSRQGFHNRARLRIAQEPGLAWVSVPCHRAGTPPLTAVRPDDATPWARRLRRAVHVAYAAAPFYEHHAEALDRLFYSRWGSLADLACATVAWTRDALGAACALDRASARPGAPDALGAVWDALHPAPEEPPPVLLTLPESAARDAARLAGRAEVRVLRFEEPARRQVFDGFVPGASALDLILNYGPSAAEVLRRGIREGG